MRSKGVEQEETEGGRGGERKHRGCEDEDEGKKD